MPRGLGILHLIIPFLLYCPNVVIGIVVIDNNVKAIHHGTNRPVLQTRGLWPSEKSSSGQNSGEYSPSPDSSTSRSISATPVTINQLIQKWGIEAEWTVVNGEYCWNAHFTNAQYDQLFGEPWEMYTARSNSNAELKLEVPQRNAPFALQILSSSSNKFPTLERSSAPFECRANAGKGITVYILDHEFAGDGAFHTYMPVFLTMDDKGEPVREEKIWKNAPTRSHGAMMAALIADSMLGVAKQAQIVAVEIGAFKRGQPVEYEEDRIFAAVTTIIKDVKGKKLKGKAVIYLASHWQGEHLNESFKNLFLEASKLGIVLVTGAGDKGPVTEMTSNPIALYAKINGYPLIIAGALSTSFERHRVSQGVVESDVWAPGWFEDQEFEDQDKVTVSTSASAARIAGLAAYFMSTVDFSQSKGPYDKKFAKHGLADRNLLVKNYIVGNARSIAGGPLIAGNGMGDGAE